MVSLQISLERNFVRRQPKLVRNRFTLLKCNFPYM